MEGYYPRPYIQRTWQVHPGFRHPVSATIALPISPPPRQPPTVEQPPQIPQVLNEALNSLKQMRAEIHGKFRDVDTKMQGMHDKLRGVDTRMEEIHDKLRDGMERTQNKLRDVDTGMKVMYDNVGHVNTRVEGIGEQVMDQVQTLQLDLTKTVQKLLPGIEQRVATELETFVERRETAYQDLLEKCYNEFCMHMATWAPTQPPSQQTVAAKGSCTRTRPRRKSLVENWDNVKKLHDKRTFRHGKSGVVKYLVEWEGQDKSWEPASKIKEDVPAIVKEFEELNALKNQTRKGRKRRQRL